MHPSTAIALRTLVLALLAGASLLLTSPQPAGAQATEVRLTGDNANNFFIVRALSATQIEFCTDLLGCFTRNAADVQRIAIDGLDGDDGLFVQHQGAFIAHPTVPISLTFDGGVGSDEVRICVIGACGPTVTTDISVLPETDEIRIVQCEGSMAAGGMCVDEPFQQPVRTLKMNVRGADVITDMSRGPMTVIGTPGPDTVTVDAGESFSQGQTGRVSVDNLASLQFLNKENLTLDTGAGADTISVTTRLGLASTTRSCARDGAAGVAPVCIRAGTDGGDHVAVPPGTAGQELSLLTRDVTPADTSRLTGLERAPVIDLTGVDTLSIPVQPTRGDTFSLVGSPGADLLAWDATVPGSLTVSGTLQTTTTSPATIPVVTLAGDGTGPLAAAILGGGGADLVTGTTGSGPDDVAAAPAGPGGVLLRHTAGSTPHSVVTVESPRVDLATGDGPDVLRTSAALPVDLRWQAGPGADTLVATGDGRPLTAATGTGRVGHGDVAADPFAGVTAVDAEAWQVDAATARLSVRGTPGADVFRYSAADASSATIQRDGGPVITAGNVGVMELDPGAGDDQVTVAATTGPDDITIGRGLSTITRVGAALALRATAATESVVVEGLAGDDRFIVTGAGGASTIVLDGGIHTGGDRLSVAAAVLDATLALDAAPASGTLVADGPAIAFRDLEHVDVEGDGTGSFTVRGSDADDTIVQDGNTVTAGRGTTAAFTRYPVLRLEGRAGDDDVVVSPRGLAGVTAVEVDGGDAGLDRVTVNGSALRETIAFLPDGADRARVEVSLAAPVSLVGVEEVEVDGRTAAPTGDTLLVRSPALSGTVVATPGETVDAGSVQVVDAAGPASSGPVLHFGRLGRGSVVVDGRDADGVAADSLRVLGRPHADVFSVTADGAGGATTVLNTRIPLVATGVHALHLHGLDGADTFHLPLAHDLPTGPGAAIVVDGGGAAAGDLAVVTATGPVVTDLAGRRASQLGQRPVAFGGLDRIDLAAGGHPATVLGGEGPDALVVRPTGPASAQVTADLLPTRLDVADAASLLVDARGGADTLSVLGGSTAETIRVTRGALPRVAVGGALPVTATEALEALHVDGREGADTIVVDGAGGPASLAVDGGLPAADGDRLALVSADAVVTFDDPATQGRLDGPGGALAFTGIDVLEATGDGTGALTVRGTDAPDTITLGDPPTPTVRVNGGAAVVHAGFPTLRLDGRGGGDTITISYATLGDVTAIEAIGGSAQDDVVRIVDTLGTARRWRVAPTDADSAVVTAVGVPSVASTGAAEVRLVGRGAGDQVEVVSPPGAQDVVVGHAPVVDAGAVRVGSLVPLRLEDLGADAVLHIADEAGAAVDHVVIDGGQGPDTIRVLGADRRVDRAGALGVVVDHAAAVTVRGFDGADTFAATGPLPWGTTTFDGGAPSSGDRVVLDGPVGEATVDVGAASVIGYGGTVRVPEVEVLETAHAGLGLISRGTDRDDAMCVDPMSPRDGRMHIITSPGGGLLTDSCQPATGSLDLLHTFLDVGTLVVDPRAGADQVLVNGTVEPDAVVVESFGPAVVVTVHPSPAATSTVRLPVTILTPTTENVIVATDNGADNVDVRLHEAAAPALTIHGEAPDTRRADHLTVRDMTGGANIGNTGSAIKGSGTVAVDWRRFSGIEVQVSYTGIEEVRTLKGQRA